MSDEHPRREKSLTTESLEFRYHRHSQEDRERILKRLTGILSKNEQIEFGVVHGSFTKGLPFRDIDIAIYLNSCDDESVFHYTVEYAAELEGILRLPIDIQVLNDAPLPFRYHAMTEGILVFCQEDFLYYSVLDATTRMYLDFQFLLTSILE